MNTIGFVMSKKENESRRCLIPAYIKDIENKDCLRVEPGYGDCLGFCDSDYEKAGAKIVMREDALRCNIICDPKIGDADYLKDLKEQTVFGWLHAVQNRSITDTIIEQKLTAFAWEDMFESGRHIFWRNNEIAGESAIMHAFQTFGVMPYNTKVAILGKGNVAAGAMKILTLLGADVVIYDRKTEAALRHEIERYDVFVNAVLWDTSRRDHIIYETDLAHMKPGAMIIDISCDRAGAVESSIPTTIENPTYEKGGIWHYVVDHTPSLFYKTASFEITKAATPFYDELICGKPGEVLSKGCIAKNGIIIDKKIIDFQNR